MCVCLYVLQNIYYSSYSYYLFTPLRVPIYYSLSAVAASTSAVVVVAVVFAEYTLICSKTWHATSSSSTWLTIIHCYRSLSCQGVKRNDHRMRDARVNLWRFKGLGIGLVWRFVERALKCFLIKANIDSTSILLNIWTCCILLFYSVCYISIF